MILLETQTILPNPIEDVYALIVDLEKAPRWHTVLTVVQQLTTPPIGIGTRWKMHYKIGSFVLEITDYQSPHRVTFQGSTVIGGTIPNFTIELQTVAEGTQVRYLIHPNIPPVLRPLMAIVVPPYAKRDLARYFRELKTMLATRHTLTS